MNSEEQQLNLELIELIEQIKKFPPKSRERLKWLNKLIDVIQGSGNLTTVSTFVSRKGYLRVTYQFNDLYADALGDTFLYIAQNIDDYDPTKKVLAWVNQTLKWNFLTAFNREYRNRSNEVNRQTTSLDALQNSNFNFDVPASAPPDENEQDYRSYRRVVQEDPEGLLASIKLTYTNQETNVQESISLKKILLMLSNGKTLMDIHREYHIPRQSLYSFIERNLSPVKEKDSKKQKAKKQKLRDYFAKYSRS